MSTLGRNAQVLRYFLQVAPGSGRTQLMKFAYLADLEARKYLGRPISELEYIRYDHGPFDPSLYGALDELEKVGLATHELVYFPNGMTGYSYSPAGSGVAYEFTAAESAVLEHVGRTYMGMTARQLCDEVVYQTPPMKAKVAMNDPLPMDMMNRGLGSGFEFDLERLVKSEESAKAGRHRPLNEALSELLVACDARG